jgi:hypothetical protein
MEKQVNQQKKIIIRKDRKKTQQRKRLTQIAHKT